MKCEKEDCQWKTSTRLKLKRNWPRVNVHGRLSVFRNGVSILMLILMAVKPGGPFKTQRRTVYCFLYLVLLFGYGNCHDSEPEILEEGK